MLPSKAAPDASGQISLSSLKGTILFPFSLSRHHGFHFPALAGGRFPPSLAKTSRDFRPERRGQGWPRPFRAVPSESKPHTNKRQAKRHRYYHSGSSTLPPTDSHVYLQQKISVVQPPFKMHFIMYRRGVRRQACRHLRPIPHRAYHRGRGEVPTADRSTYNDMGSMLCGRR